MKTRRKRAVGSSGVSAAPTPRPATFTVQDLLPRVASLLHSLDYPSAILFVRKAVALRPEDPRILDLAGRVALEVGEVDEARERFVKAEELDPTPADGTGERTMNAFLGNVEEDKAWSDPVLRAAPWTRCMCLGQLVTGTEAASWFQKGLAMLESRIAELEKENGLAPGALANGRSDGTMVPPITPASDQEDPLTTLRSEAASALCGLVELYMTDLCDEPLAEQLASTYAHRALHHAPHSPEALQTLASLLITQQRPNEAREVAKRALAGWLDSVITALDGAEAAVAPVDPSSATLDMAMPPYPSRLSLAKLLIELDDLPRAFDVLRTCVAEDDEQMEGWYVWGWGYYLAGMKVGAEEGGAGASTASAGEERTRSEWFADARDCFRQLEKLYGRYRRQHEEEKRSAVGSVDGAVGNGMDEGEEVDEELAAFTAMVTHATELLQEMEKLGGFAEGEDEDGDNGEDGDDAWEELETGEDGDGDEEMEEA
ncbi:hypothetical protein HDU93_010080 [Gonapodya sp. JEL0774]|nr:hypothetical protein HDU93_010080 [Gonapodya sp. JEL0774]